MSHSYSNLTLEKGAKILYWPLEQMVLGKQDIHMDKTAFIPLSLKLYKNNSKSIKELNVNPKTLKVLVEH
jgi:hypothetical protein